MRDDKGKGFVSKAMRVSTRIGNLLNFLVKVTQLINCFEPQVP